MKEKKRSSTAVLLEYAGNYRGLTYLGLLLSAAAMVLGMLPYICIWLVVRDLVIGQRRFILHATDGWPLRSLYWAFWSISCL
ncbi:MAG: hypothetical protein IJH98_00400 [Solobacterium sp.]|nr:hypothetical protein [Solobacterium sp.]